MRFPLILPLLAPLLAAAGCFSDPLGVAQRTDAAIRDTQRAIEQSRLQQPRPLVRRHSGPYLDRNPLAGASTLAYMDERVSLHVGDLPLRECIQRAAARLSRRLVVGFEQEEIANRSISLAFDGRFEGLLEALADASGYGYDVSDSGALVWKRELTRTFELWRVPGDRDYALGGRASTGSALSGGGGGGSSGSVDATPIVGSEGGNLTSEGDFWGELEAALQAILGEEGEVVRGESTSAVTVSGEAARVRAAGRYIDKLNRNLTRQILLEVQVLQVRLNDSAEQGINWQLVRGAVEQMAGTASFEAAGTLQGEASAGGLTLPSFTFRGGKGSLSADVFVRALRGQGEVSVQTSPRLVTLNGELARILLLDDRAYIAGTEVTRSEEGRITAVELEPGTISVGVSVHLLPKIVEQDILLQSSVSISELVGLTEAGTDSTVQLPEVARNQFYQSSLLQTGEALVIGGVRQQRASRDGAHLPGLKALGSKAQEIRSSESVLLITPTLLPGAEQGT